MTRIAIDGFLRVHDLYALNGATELVVLSACRTAAGKQLRGEERWQSPYYWASFALYGLP